MVKNWLIPASVSAAALALLASGPNAFAATGPHTGHAVRVHSTRLKMYTARVVAVDSAGHAKTHKITVRYDNGRKIVASDELLPYYTKALAATRARKLRPNTSDEPMSCGTAWVNIGEYNGRPANMETGFESNTGVLQIDWNVDMNGPNYSYSYNAAPYLWGDTSWAGSHHSHTAYPHGQWQAKLKHGSFGSGTYITLDNGLGCFPGSDLTDTEWL
ncbi:hypothetical protein [Actinoallomurus sp. CA-150999]|uniref:hypothetical protein n=1 Tax=Actinoallomurus sp. CA-150999 TaxID=3239887 RepID=UPI003D932463